MASSCTIGCISILHKKVRGGFAKMFKGNKKQFYISIVAGIAIIGLATGFYLKAAAKPEIKEEVLTVRTKTMGGAVSSPTYSYSGEVCGRYESQLAFQVSGKIIKRRVELGTIVKPGDVLMEIDAKDIRQNLNSNSAGVYSAQAQLKLAESNLDRYRKLYAENAISQSQLDQYQNAYETAKASVQQASAQYAQGANQLDYSLLTSDRGGVVSSISAEAGQVVSSGQAVVTIVQDGEREIEINVPENRIGELRKMENINVTFWALPNLTIPGKIREVSPIADKVSRTYKVRISLINPPQEVKLGMTATVVVNHTGSVESQFYVPLSAIYQNGQQPCVWVVNDGIVTLRPITVGYFGKDSVQVLSGIKAGDVVITAGVHKVREGQRVAVTGDSL